jgi:hypothetical protein
MSCILELESLEIVIPNPSSVADDGCYNFQEAFLAWPKLILNGFMV